MAAHGSRRQAQPVGERSGALRATLEDQPGDRVTGAIVAGEFHNISMTYFRRAFHTAPPFCGPG